LFDLARVQDVPVANTGQQSKKTRQLQGVINHIRELEDRKQELETRNQELESHIRYLQACLGTSAQPQ
jgi:hypothetical protein